MKKFLLLAPMAALALAACDSDTREPAPTPTTTPTGQPERDCDNLPEGVECQ